MGLTVGFDTSAGEQVAEQLPQSRVVKAFNSVLAPNHNPVAFEAGSVFVPVAGDDEAAVESVVDFAKSLGFDAVAAGPLKNARYTEPLAELLVQLAYGQGAGTGISVRLQRAN
ncbi:MAG: hypothetical protein E7Z96_07185 [Actinomycetaceae bacterium]|nr:hypothetical protein [Actinomycetaceae bacterium]